MIFGFLVNMKNTIAIYSYFTTWVDFFLKNDALPLNSLFWSPPTAINRFDSSVPGLYIFCVCQGSWVTNITKDDKTCILMSKFPPPLGGARVGGGYVHQGRPPPSTPPPPSILLEWKARFCSTSHKPGYSEY